MSSFCKSDNTFLSEHNKPFSVHKNFPLGFKQQGPKEPFYGRYPEDSDFQNSEYEYYAQLLSHLGISEFEKYRKSIQPTIWSLFNFERLPNGPNRKKFIINDKLK
jgi:hypothetical protein